VEAEKLPVRAEPAQLLYLQEEVLTDPQGTPVLMSVLFQHPWPFFSPPPLCLIQ
jgi:hypothetical protein